ncbi:hypothetical protein LTR22_012843 [Elasticomyces elasticus]|nr:hypothetical protein LTR22_012843 [Elasticomyces elasticus]KAK4918114.1 hypothetical protein LTR49_014118 [Elasticomyces elasticus]KAK5757387.1 hypothetical protein LTS12_012470 [Elasticomyces elasticus]
MAAHKRKAKGEPDSSKKKQAPATSAASRRITRTMTTDGPRQAVFATAELIENILMHAPVRSIFAIQRVAQQFRDIVVGSVSLQQRMFLRPQKSVLAETWTLVQKQEDEIEHELEDGEEEYRVIRVADSVDLSAFLASNGLNPEYSSRPATVLNPLLKRHDDDHDNQIPVEYRIEYEGELLTLNISEGMHWDVGSWRNTYFTDQPCMQLSMTATWRIKPRKEPLIVGYVSAQAETKSRHGYTLGTFLDAALREATYTGTYHVGSKKTVCHDPLHTLLKRLEQETGKKATLTDIVIGMHDVVIADGHERDAVQDADDSMIPR